jgi:predicted nucleic acid-binding protein
VIIVDASVALKWYVAEPDAPLADAILASAEPLAAPELIVAEVSNAAWRAWRRGQIGAEQQAQISADILNELDRLERLAPLIQRAAAIAREIDHPIYDCLYLALSEAQNAPLVTADERLLSKVRGTSFAERTLSLSAYAGQDST